MDRAGNLGEGVSELREKLSKPGDPLHRHLSDLLTALQGVSFTSPHPRKLKRRRSIRTNSETIGSTETWKLARAHLSDSSPPRIHHKRFVHTTPEGTVDPGSDTDNEQQPRNSSRGKSVANKKLVLGHHSSRHLQPPLSFLAESDSFTETFSPGSRQQRKKRFIKRMAVDSPDHTPRSDGGGSVEMEASPVRYKRWKQRSGVERSYGGGMDYESNLSSSDSPTDEHDGEADDEQSDWFFEPPPSPPSPSTLRTLSPPPLLQPPPESSDTDVSQSGYPHPMLQHQTKRPLSKPGTPVAAAINRKLVQFMNNPSQTEYRVSQLSKVERRQLLRLAAFYHLQVHYERKRRRLCILLTKTT